MVTIMVKIPSYAQKIIEQEKRQMNIISIAVPAYSRSGTLSIWEEGYKLYVDVDETTTIVIRADKGGLISLARHLLTLAQDDYPIGSHIHYDAGTSLEDDSYPLIVDKIREQDSVKQENSTIL